MPLTNDLSNLAAEANAIFNSITANSTAITAISVAGQVINSSGFAVTATFSNTFTVGNAAFFAANGNVGIGTSGPSYKLVVENTSLGNTAGDIKNAIQLFTTTTNGDSLNIFKLRTSNGTTWQTASWRLQQRVDVDWHGYIEFNGNNNNGISFGTGSSSVGPNSIQERMRIDSAGRVIKPYQPAFRATGTATKDGSNYLFNFNAVPVNVGGHYNNSNGRFTAPVAGVYAFYYQLYTGAGTMGFTIRKNGSQIAFVDFGSTFGMHPGTFVIDSLAAGDYVQVLVSAGPAGDINDFFCGYFLG